MANVGDEKYLVPASTYTAQPSSAAAVASERPKRYRTAADEDDESKRRYKSGRSDEAGKRFIYRRPTASAQTIFDDKNGLRMAVMNYLIDRRNPCIGATNDGNRCGRAWTYRDPAGNRLDCAKYCVDNCAKWLPPALQTPPDRVRFWSDGRLQREYFITSWNIDINDRKTGDSLAEYSLNRRLGQYVWKALDDDGGAMTIEELTASICRGLSKGQEVGFRIYVQPNRDQRVNIINEARLETEDDWQAVDGVTFGTQKRPNDTTWIRPNAEYEIDTVADEDNYETEFSVVVKTELYPDEPEEAKPAAFKPDDGDVKMTATPVPTTSFPASAVAGITGNAQPRPGTAYSSLTGRPVVPSIVRKGGGYVGTIIDCLF